MIAVAMDRSALSDELHFAASSPLERYHLDRGRANVLRSLVISEDDAVLELGAEYGPLTRYLGEQARLVHAVEPDQNLAKVAAIRTQGLDSVQVIAGSLDALPTGLGYDLAVIAAPFAAPHVLGAVRARLRHGGAMCIMTEDLAGRREVEAALRSAGITLVRTLTCTPNVHISRAVLSNEIVRELPQLANELGWTGQHGHVLLAGEGAVRRWPADLLATYYNTAERAAWSSTRADVVRTADGAEVRHAPLLPDHPPVGGISVRTCVDVVYDAPTILSVLLDEPWRVNELLVRWGELLRSQESRVGDALWDMVPHNVLVDGVSLYPIDLEWRHAGAGVPEVTERGLLVLAYQLTRAGWSGAAPDATMRETAGWLGVLLDLEPSYVDDAVVRETRFATIASCGTERATEEVHRAIRAVWEGRLMERTARSHSSALVHAGRNKDEK